MLHRSLTIVMEIFCFNVIKFERFPLLPWPEADFKHTFFSSFLNYNILLGNDAWWEVQQVHSDVIFLLDV